MLLLFNAGGRQREAAWSFDPLARTVSAVDDEARWLSEDEDQQAPGPIPAPHLAASTRPSRVYDVEAEGGVGASATRRREGETVDLMAAMRERSAQRGRRRRPKSTEVPGLDEAPEEALPLEEVARDPRDELPPPAHTHPEDDPDVVKTGTVEERVGAEAAQRQVRRTEPTQPLRQVPSDTTEADPAPRVESADHPPVEPEAVVGDDGTEGHADSADSADNVASSDVEQPAASEAATETNDGEAVDAVDIAATVDDEDRHETGSEPEAPDDEPLFEERPLRPAVRRRPEPRPVSRTAAERGGGSDDATEAAGSDPVDEDGDGHEVIEERPLAPRAKPTPRPCAGGAQVRPAERAELGRHHVRPQERVT